MSEQYKDSDDYSHLSFAEVYTLARRAIEDGEPSRVDYPDEQPDSVILPYTFTLEVDPEPFQVLVAEWSHHGFETVTRVELEYDDTRVLGDDRSMTQPTVYVSVSSLIFDTVNPTFRIQKDVVYTLPLDINARAYVKEAYGEATHRRYELLHDDVPEFLEMMAEETRPLNDGDVALLRVLLS